MSEGRGASIRACTRPTTRSSQAQAAAHNPPLLIPSRRRLHCRRRPSSRDRSLLDQSLSREMPRGGGTAFRRGPLRRTLRRTLPPTPIRRISRRQLSHGPRCALGSSHTCRQPHVELTRGVTRICIMNHVSVRRHCRLESFWMSSLDELVCINYEPFRMSSRRAPHHRNQFVAPTSANLAYLY